EFNVFGHGYGSKASFPKGTSAVVRIEVGDWFNGTPGCELKTFAAESNNLTLQNIPHRTTTDVSVAFGIPTLLFAEGYQAPSTAADCTGVLTSGWGPALTALQLRFPGLGRQPRRRAADGSAAREITRRTARSRPTGDREGIIRQCVGLDLER